MNRNRRKVSRPNNTNNIGPLVPAGVNPETVRSLNKRIKRPSAFDRFLMAHNVNPNVIKAGAVLATAFGVLAVAGALDSSDPALKPGFPLEPVPLHERGIPVRESDQSSAAAKLAKAISRGESVVAIPVGPGDVPSVVAEETAEQAGVKGIDELTKVYEAQTGMDGIPTVDKDRYLVPANLAPQIKAGLDARDAPQQ